MQRRWATIYIAFFLVLAAAAVAIDRFASGTTEPAGPLYVLIFSLGSAFFIAALAFLPRRG